MNIRVHIYFQINFFVFFGHILRSGTGGLYGSYNFTFLKNLHIIFHSDCTSLHPHYVKGFPFLILSNICFLFDENILVGFPTGKPF